MSSLNRRDQANIHLLRQVARRRGLDIGDELGALATGPLSELARERLRGIVADELVEEGLDEHSEPTKHGRVLEELMDWLGQE